MIDFIKSHKWQAVAISGWVAFALMFIRFWVLVWQTMPYVPDSWK